MAARRLAPASALPGASIDPDVYRPCHVHLNWLHAAQRQHQRCPAPASNPMSTDPAMFT
ncbi:MAG: hypothetical protein ACOY0T_14325 [Myxococcota bacterium]